MSASPGGRALPASRYDLTTYWGRVRQCAEIADPRTLFVSAAGLARAKATVEAYKRGSGGGWGRAGPTAAAEKEEVGEEIWRAKKIVDATLHPDTGEPILLPFRMSCFVLSNLVVTAGMLTPGLTTRGTLLWQVANQSLNVGINASNANWSAATSTGALAASYAAAVAASCGAALGLGALVPRLRGLSPGTRTVLARLVPFAAVASAGALNVLLMRAGEMARGIDVYPAPPTSGGEGEEGGGRESLGRSKRAARLAVGETAVSRVLNSAPVMVLPALALVRLQRTEWLRRRPRLTLPVNLGLILTTSLFALPLALAAFPQRQAVPARSLEPEFWGRGGRDGLVEFNRGI